MKLYVKGNKFESAKAAADRGIPFAFIEERRGSTIGETSVDQWDRVVKWYCESNHNECKDGLGYPIGTLLFYSGGTTESF